MIIIIINKQLGDLLKMKNTQAVKKSTTQTSTNNHRANHNGNKQQRYGLSAYTGIAAGTTLILCNEIEDEKQGQRYLDGLFE